MADEAKTSWFQKRFPVRYLYLRTGDDVRAVALKPWQQVVGTCGIAALALWTVVASAGFTLDLMHLGAADRAVERARAASERANADLRARLDTAVVRMTATSGSLDELAHMVERRHVALTQVMTMFRGVDGAEALLVPTVSDPDAPLSPTQRIVGVRLDQETLIDRAENLARTRAERLRLAFRLAGLNPAAYAVGGPGLGGPLVTADDPRALAAILDVDEPFAARILNASTDLSDMRSLTAVSAALPFARPTDARVTSGFGLRFDPFNARPAYHQGQDFAGPLNTAIVSTAPGIVSFVGVRSGYGNTVEIDHGRGFKTRYAHLNSTAVTVGQRVAVGHRIGAMGTTGRSTGVHLHYEVWMDGRPQNPARFMRAGDHLVQ
ncbi:MAG TPA: peptidoglycan DD-metalloendopeptidase family protein [Brevundimonas sp.]|jgi:murein DD-endopeptidase MepM/ murein hydrolase activator NlpD|uniref:peptidoglycan DD-metalloendopeptidase family protein n=1 Tax=Brevundimonas sp. TaxID=1871086 RepID=UPI002DE59B71|nr:peptidoglycan DD-metalloendopeptidase family protein [Brevundimonas sp.]